MFMRYRRGGVGHKYMRAVEKKHENMTLERPTESPKPSLPAVARNPQLRTSWMCWTIIPSNQAGSKEIAMNLAMKTMSPLR